MNIVNAGARYQVYGEDVKTFKRLPNQTYTIGFHPQMGFWLNEHVDLDNNEAIIYGKHKTRAEKIIRSYQASDRNFGVILSGKKGIGKSLLARMIAEKAIENDMPVIIVDRAIAGISDFLSSINQEVVVIFDEFEKVFAKTEHGDPQVELLSLFDGIDGGKKLFIITCNDPRQLNEFLVNRPGRFHYHFEISCPTGDEVRAYMFDKLGDGYDEEIDKVIKLASMADITYDCLRAIAFDLKQGYPLEETLEDLNINYEHGTTFDINIRLSNGWTITAFSKKIDLYDKDNVRATAYKGKERYFFDFNPTDIEMKDGVLCLPAGKGKFYCDWDCFEDEMSDEDAARTRKEFNSTIKVESATFVKVISTYINKYDI